MLLVLIAVLVALFVVLPLIGMALWAVISTVIVGLFMGALGRLVVPGAQRIGFVRTVVAGLCGSIVGGFLGQHVLGVGSVLTVLIEIGISAGIVAVLASGGGRRQLTAGPRGSLRP